MGCGAICEPFPVLDAEAQVARRPSMKPARLLGLSEKQYQTLAGVATNCRFFPISVAALNLTSASPYIFNHMYNAGNISVLQAVDKCQSGSGRKHGRVPSDPT
jgi:hypothetical protein